MGFDGEDPFWWHIEPGIAAVCRLINDTGLGATEFSCEGHTLCERSQYSEGVDPYVLFAVNDRERADQLAALLPEVKGDGYHCEMRDKGDYLSIYLTVQPYHDFYTITGHKDRRRALERARAHLTAVMAQLLAPDTPLFACPARRCIHHQEDNLAPQRHRYSPEYTCGRSETVGVLLTYAATTTYVQRCPHYRRKQGALKEVGQGDK